MPLSAKGHYRVEIIKNPENLPGITTSQIATKSYQRGGRGRPEEPSYGCVKLSDPRTKNQQAKNYICVDQNDAFQVKVYATNMQDTETYGAVLFLDGQRIHGKKTFRRVTSFPGYKKGGGCYSEFLFSVPNFGDERQLPSRHAEEQRQRFGPGSMSETEQQLEEKHKGKTGTIIVEFYRTEEFERRMAIPNRVHGKKYTDQQVMQDVSKKNFSDSLCIKKGKDFQISTGKFAGNQQPSPTENHHGGNGGGYYGSGRGGDSYGSRYQNNDSYSDSGRGGGGANSSSAPFRKRDQKFQDKRNQSYQNYGGSSHGQSYDSYRGGGGGGSSRHNNGSSRGGGDSRGDPRSSNNGPGGSSWHNSGPGSQGGGGGSGGPAGETMVDYKVMYDQEYDCVEIHYSNWAYLQCSKLVDIKQYEHVRLTPQSLMNSPDFVTKVLWAVIQYNRKLHHSKCDDEFYKATGHKISDYFEFKEGDLIIFLKKRQNMFIVDEKGWAQAKDYDERKEFNLNQSTQRKALNPSASNNASKETTPATATSKPQVTATSNREVPQSAVVIELL